MTTTSYKVINELHEADLECAHEKEGEPCWGEVRVQDITYTEEGDDYWELIACEGHRDVWATGKYIPEGSEPTLHQCGPSTTLCKCSCPDGDCEHVWDGPEEVERYEKGNVMSASSTCSKCGISAMSHDVRVCT